MEQEQERHELAQQRAQLAEQLKQLEGIEAQKQRREDEQHHRPAAAAELQPQMPEEQGMERINSLRDRLQKVELEQAGPSSSQKVGSMARQKGNREYFPQSQVDLWSLLKRQRSVIARREHSEEEIRASLREMELIQRELANELKGMFKRKDR
jgi:hypothetical protein